MEWNIQLPNKNCTHCAGAFRDAEVCHSFLKMQAVELSRQDYCDVCFGALKEQIKADPEQAYWKTRYKVIIPPPKIDPVKKDKVEFLLRDYLAGEMDEETKKVCYLLAVMLERKRVLKLLKTFVDGESGKKIIAYQHAKTGESFAILDPGLSMQEIPQLQVRVKALLDSLDRPAQTDIPAETPAPDGGQAGTSASQ